MMNLRELPRLLRVQFTPIMIAPVLLGGAGAVYFAHSFSPVYFVLALVGAFSLHLAANGIDDAYDFVNGTDGVAERMFPRDAPGWKPIPRGVLSLGQAFAVSYLLYGVSLAIGVLLSFLVGWFALVIAVPGILLSYFYTAPPLKLDYRGMGLGELSVLFSFGPIPALGSAFVASGSISPAVALIAVPSGLLTVSILMAHDQIYFDVYKESGKRSLTVILGRKRAALFATALSVLSYAFLGGLVFFGVAPVWSLVAFAAVPFGVRAANLGKAVLPPPAYGSKTMAAFLQSTLFTILVAAGLLLA